MAVTFVEKHDSRSIQAGERVDLLLFVYGAADEGAAIAALAANPAEAPATLSIGGTTYTKQSPDLKYWAEGPVYLATVSYTADGYAKPSPLATGESRYSFEIGTESVHITQGYDGDLGLTYTPPDEVAPSYMGAINVTDSGVEGVDIDGATYRWTETHVFEAATVDATFKAKLYAVKAAPVNDDTFRGFAAGEVRFMGARGTQRADGRYEITYEFAAQPNVTGLTVGTIINIAKLGWELLWIRYAKTVDETAKVTIMQPVAATVIPVYGESDFDDLGIG